MLRRNLYFEQMIDSKKQQIIKEITAKFNPSLVGVFGSYARGQQGIRSDLNILIDFDHRVNLLDLIGLENELSKKLGIRVDLVTARSLHQRLRPIIERDLIRIPFVYLFDTDSLPFWYGGGKELVSIW